MCPAFEIAETLELAQQVVDRLSADPQPRRQLGRSHPVGPRVLEDVQVRRVEVGEAPLAQPVEHSPLHGFPGHSQQRADQRRSDRVPGGSFCKGT
jgi:hypothetical protein